jgi:hypothetical protein
MFTMNEEITQAELSPEEAKASLGLSTRLSEQFLMSQAQQNGTEAPQGGETDPEETEKEPQEDKMMAMEGKMDEKMEILRTEMKDTIKNEIGSIRDEIKSAIEDDQA